MRHSWLIGIGPVLLGVFNAVGAETPRFVECTAEALIVRDDSFRVCRAARGVAGMVVPP